MLKDFKEFIAKGNVMDLAVGVVIGGAFGKIVTSLVNDIIMPLVGLLVGGIDFSNLFIALDGGTYQTLADAQELDVATLNYGLFIGSVIDFLIIAASIFIVIRQITKLKKVEEVEAEVEVTTKECPYCISEIPIEATRCPHCTSELKETV